MALRFTFSGFRSKMVLPSSHRLNLAALPALLAIPEPLRNPPRQVATKYRVYLEFGRCGTGWVSP